MMSFNNIKDQINPYNNKNKAISKNDVQNILKKYGVFENINNLEMYQEAFVHESYSAPYIKNVIERDGVSLIKQPDGVVAIQKQSYERLEYLGDAVIEIIISNYLYNRYPMEDEGFLSRLRVGLVNRLALSHLTDILGIGKYLIISKTLEDKESGRRNESFMEDIFEAFIGAIFTDFNNNHNISNDTYSSAFGLQIVERFLIQLIEDESTGIDITDLILNDGNRKGLLVKYYKKIYKTSISFQTINREGTSGDKEITVEAIRNDTKQILATGTGPDLKQAQHDSAYNALKKLGLLK